MGCSCAKAIMGKSLGGGSGSKRRSHGEVPNRSYPSPATEGRSREARWGGYVSPPSPVVLRRSRKAQASKDLVTQRPFEARRYHAGASG